MWYLENLPLSKNVLRDVSRNRSGPSSTITASTTHSVVYGPFQDWRKPIRRDLIPLHTNVRIKGKLQGKSSISSSPPSPPTSSGGPVGPKDRPLSKSRNDTPSTVNQIHRSAPPTAVSQQPPLSRTPGGPRYPREWQRRHPS